MIVFTPVLITFGHARILLRFLFCFNSLTGDLCLFSVDPARDRLKQLAKAISSKIGQASTTKAGNLNAEIRQLTEASKDQKKRKKRGKNMVDGEVIAGLAKTEAYQNPAEETEEERKKNENYVLQTLFRKTTVHSAVPFEDVANGTQRVIFKLIKSAEN